MGECFFGRICIKNVQKSACRYVLVIRFDSSTRIGISKSQTQHPPFRARSLLLRKRQMRKGVLELPVLWGNVRLLGCEIAELPVFPMSGVR
jgi:hypothetical protein